MDIRCLLLLSIGFHIGESEPVLHPRARDHTNCHSDEFACDNKQCIPKTSYCDGGRDCRDGSDEMYYDLTLEQNGPLGTPCRADQYICTLSGTQLSNKKSICTKGDNCTNDEYACKDGSKCIPLRRYCDGFKDCRDGSDEFPKNRGTPCRRDIFICGLPEYQISKENDLCTKDPDCAEPNEFKCRDGSGCLPAKLFCNGRPECRDESDENPVNRSAPERACRRKNYICDLPAEQNTKREGLACMPDGGECSEDEFNCTDGSACLTKEMFCNNRPECKDQSDERKTASSDDVQTQTCNGVGRFTQDPLTCKAPRSWKCKQGEDPCSNEGAGYQSDKCFRCLSNSQILLPIAKLCNNIIDCPDLSDECMCKKKPKICDAVNWGKDKNAAKDRRFSCRCKFVTPEKICDGSTNCIANIDEEDCSKDIRASGARDGAGKNYVCRNEPHSVPIKRAVSCNGVPECDFDVYGEECESCRDPPAFCRFLYRSLNAGSTERSIMECDTTEEWDKENIAGFVYGSSICDGTSDCGDEKDEMHCSDKTHYYCKKGTEPPYIPIEQKCNQKPNCHDVSDEEGCSFQCRKNGEIEYIRDDQECDGSADCDDGQDECTSKCIPSSAFSDEKSMIKNKVVLGFLLFISVFAVAGNGTVITTTIRGFFQTNNQPFLRCDRNKERRNQINRLLILNLAISDFLVGIYTLVICIQSLITDGKYCKADREWRTGSTCSLMGSLLVIGSEQSVFTMILITANRLMSVRWPFAEAPKKRFWVAIGAAWIISITLAVIPLIPSLEDIFTTTIWYQKNPLFKTINQTEVIRYTNWLLLTGVLSGEQNGTIGSWLYLENLIRKVNPTMEAGLKYGFYSSHTVCIPDLFPDRENIASWWYSLLLIIINFVAFVIILVGCINIYRSATQVSKTLKKSNDRSSTMQKKLTAIVITDFLCWMPVCVMAFLRLTGVVISDDWRLVVGLIIIPINSAVNPIIYSKLPELFWAKSKPFRSFMYNACLQPVGNFFRTRVYKPCLQPVAKFLQGCCAEPTEEKDLEMEDEPAVELEVSNEDQDCNEEYFKIEEAPEKETVAKDIEVPAVTVHATESGKGDGKETSF